MDQWYLDNLVCPVDKTRLEYKNGVLISDSGRIYPAVDGIPVMLLDDVEQTISLASASLGRARSKPDAIDVRAEGLYLESLGISEKEKEGVIQLAASNQCTIDPVVSFIIGATSGYAYIDIIGKLNKYPIPELRLPTGDGQLLLDIGCNWGRWSISASRKGYDVVGLDPSLGAIMAARRVARKLGLSIRYVVGDARYLPFRSELFGHVFSYSVLQHFSKEAATVSLYEIDRILKSGGECMIQMPNFMGLRSLYHQWKRKFRNPIDFEVRYYSLPELRKIFCNTVGGPEISVDCYFGLGLQKSDMHLMSNKMKIVIGISEMLRKTSHFVPPLKYVADSVYVSSRKNEQKAGVV